MGLSSGRYASVEDRLRASESHLQNRIQEVQKLQSEVLISCANGRVWYLHLCGSLRASKESSSLPPRSLLQHKKNSPICPRLKCSRTKSWGISGSDKRVTTRPLLFWSGNSPRRREAMHQRMRGCVNFHWCQCQALIVNLPRQRSYTLRTRNCRRQATCIVFLFFYKLVITVATWVFSSWSAKHGDHRECTERGNSEVEESIFGWKAGSYFEQ